ncbi:MAG TPA: efflux RND transporter periplasmic adaptor subunit, partial [Gemmatimonadaceae bacterium]|nr:efflux RND transporter periplasmic adaptor subunit [Gemmatimonadaceae bacterium]
MRDRTVLIACATTVALCSGCAKAPPKQGRPAIAVALGTVTRQDVPFSIAGIGLVTPMQTTPVVSQVDGIVTDIDFTEGQDVTKGQALFHVDPRPFQAAYDQATAVLARDRATADNAEHEVVRYDSLVKKDYVTREQADQERANAAVAAASVRSDSAAVASAKFNLDNTTVRAPISGRTGVLMLHVGNLLHASGSVPLVVINQVAPTQIRFPIPAQVLPLIHKYWSAGGLAVTAIPGGTTPTAPADSTAPTGLTPASAETTPIAAAVAASQQGEAGPAQRGVLASFDNAVDTATQTVQVKATFPNPNGVLWPGEYAEASILVYMERDALVVPAQAVVTGQHGQYVYTVDSASKAQQRTVVV